MRKLNNKLTLWNRPFLEKLIVDQRVKKFLAFYENRRSIKMLAKSLTLTPILSQMKAIYTLTSHSFKIHFNIILPFNPMSYRSACPSRYFNPNSAK
jgi:hypothetical protein